MDKNVNKYKPKSKIILFILNLLIIITIITLNIKIIHAQADYMGPGVPYSSKCYQESTDNKQLTLQYQLKLTDANFYVNKNSIAQVIIVSNKQNTPQKIQLTLTYNANLINITKLTIPVCSQSPQGTQIDNINGTATIILDSKSCPKFTLNTGKNLIASIEIIPIKTGTALIKLHAMNDNPQSYALIDNTSINIEPSQNTYEVPILQLQTTIPTTYKNPTPNPTIVPQNGIFDETNIIIAIILIGIAMVLYTSISYKNKRIKSKFINYEEE